MLSATDSPRKDQMPPRPPRRQKARAAKAAEKAAVDAARQVTGQAELDLMLGGYRNNGGYR
jgi:hypothetical protein